MSTAIRIAVSTLALLALLIIGPSARADSYEVTGHTQWAACHQFGVPCAPVQYAFQITTEPWLPTETPYLLVTSLTGEINGQRISAPSPDGLLNPESTSGPIPEGIQVIGPEVPPGPTPGYPGTVDVTFLLNGQPGHFWQPIGIGPYLFMYTSAFDVPVTWNAEKECIPTPEPGTLLLVGVGIIALGALGTTKRFL